LEAQDRQTHACNPKGLLDLAQHALRERASFCPLAQRGDPAGLVASALVGFDHHSRKGVADRQE